ncbi:unnamed protein product [Urochloa humidicola]
MAAAQGGAGSSNTNNQEDRSYFGKLTGRYLTTYGSWIAEPHTPQTNQQYAERLARSQTTTCAKVASLRYQIEKGVYLLQVTGISSHAFDRSLVTNNPSDKFICFHVNFSALVDGDKQISFFFAELVGTNSPQLVTSCVRLRLFCEELWLLHGSVAPSAGQLPWPRSACPTAARPSDSVMCAR